MSDEKPTKRPRGPRAKRQLVLAEVSEDVNTKQLCFAVINTPPLPADAVPSPRLIEAACRKAVYEDGVRDYGNRNLVVLSVLQTFEIPFVERMALAPPVNK
jgi:hypothetical protein